MAPVKISSCVSPTQKAYTSSFPPNSNNTTTTTSQHPRVSGILALWHSTSGAACHPGYTKKSRSKEKGLLAAASRPFSLDLHDSIPHQTNTINLCLHHIAGFEKLRWVACKTNATRRTSRDDIASLKRHAPGQNGDDLPHGENHHACIRILFDHAIDTQANRQLLRVRHLVSGHNPRSHRTKAVNAFPLKKLLMLELQVASADIIEHGIAKNIVEGLFLAYIFARLANNDGQFGLPVHLFRDRRVNHNIPIRPIRRGGRLGENNGMFRLGSCTSMSLRRLSGVLSIILSHAHDILTWARNGCYQLYLVDGMHSTNRGERLDLAETAASRFVKNGLQQKLPRLVLLNQILHLIRPDNRQCVRCKVEIENFVALDETQVRFGNGSSRKADKFHGDPPLQNKIRVE